MRIRFGLVALFFLGLFLVAAPLAHDTSVTWASVRIERPTGDGKETEGDPDTYNDSVSGGVRAQSHDSDTTRVPASHRPIFFERLYLLCIRLVATLTRGRWVS